MIKINSDHPIYVFIDGSVNTKTKTGVGAYCICQSLNPATNNSVVKIEVFINTSSTKLELQTLLFVLTKLQTKTNKIIIYTDSQNSISLLRRRENLESKQFKNKKGELLKNHELYKEFYVLYDSLNIELIKIKGHKPNKEKDKIDQLFSLVDKAARNALREVN